MLHLNGRYKMTATVEKKVIELGGFDPNSTLSEDQLRDALCSAIEELGTQNKMHLLEKLYEPEREYLPFQGGDESVFRWFSKQGCIISECDRMFGWISEKRRCSPEKLGGRCQSTRLSLVPISFR